MQALAAAIVRWLLRHTVVLLIIIAVLLLGRAAWAQWTAFKAIRAEYPQLVQSDKGLSDHLELLITAATRRVLGLRVDSLQTLELRISDLTGQIARKQSAKTQSGTFAEILQGKPILQAQLDSLRLDAEINLLEEERSYLMELKLRVLATQSEKAHRDKLEQLREVHKSHYREWQDTKLKLEAFEELHPLKSRLPGMAEYAARTRLQAQQDKLLAHNQQADADYRRQLGLVQATRPMAPLAAFQPDRTKVEAILRPLRDRLAELDQQRAGNWFETLLKPVEEVAPMALGILLGIILTPTAIKAVFYFWLAPLAARRPAIRLLPETTGDLVLEMGRSAVSMPVLLEAGHELLVHAEFLQSSSDRGEKDTCWLLNSNFPLTSLASGMVALTRIRTRTPEQFVISATKDPFSEVGILSLPEGAALVMQPHNLVGVVQPTGSPVRITSHWRLTSLHAWLTLQLRYLAFHGPARLIVQGGRGVRIERADAGRSINQAATIGFTANLAYSTRRCETFSAYWLGRQELLNDSFKGAQGFFVYEETPHPGKKTGMTGRGLEGLSDSLLKVFGN